MREHNHSFLRFFLDSILVIFLVLLIISPIFLLFSLKINDLNLQAKIVETVAGTQSKK
jgi:hypothetical protein